MCGSSSAQPERRRLKEDTKLELEICTLGAEEYHTQLELEYAPAPTSAIDSSHAAYFPNDHSPPTTYKSRRFTTESIILRYGGPSSLVHEPIHKQGYPYRIDGHRPTAISRMFRDHRGSDEWNGNQRMRDRDHHLRNFFHPGPFADDSYIDYRGQSPKLTTEGVSPGLLESNTRLSTSETITIASAARLPHGLLELSPATMATGAGPE